MPNDDIISRRMFLSLLCGAAFACALPTDALAKDGGDDSGDDDSGDDGNDSSGSGGSGGGSDDDNDDDSDENEDDDGEDEGPDNSKSGPGPKDSTKSNSGKRDQDRVKDAVLKGDAIPLSKALALLKDKYDGRVIEVLYAAKGNRIDYRFKILDENGKVISVTMDARTGRIRGFLGF